MTRHARYRLPRQPPRPKANHTVRAGRKGGLAATLFVWPLIGNALLNFRQRTIVLRYCGEAISLVGI